jgi:hypothetical protein
VTGNLKYTVGKLLNAESFFNDVDLFMALNFTTTGAPLAEKHMQIFPMNQYV